MAWMVLLLLLQQSEASKEEKLLAKIPESVKPLVIDFSADGRSVAYIGMRNQGGTDVDRYYVYDGDRESELYDWVGELCHGRPGLCYFAVKGKSKVAVQGGKETEFVPTEWGRCVFRPHGAGRGDVRAFFSPDAQSFVYETGSRPDSKLVVGDREIPNGSFDDPPMYAPDGKTLVVRANGKKQQLIVGDKKTEPFEWISRPAFSADGKTMAFAAWDVVEGRRKQYLVRGEDKKDISFFEIRWVGLSADGAEAAFFSEQLGKCFVQVGDKKGREYGYIRTPAFRPGTHNVVYFANHGTGWFLVDGDKIGERYQEVGPPRFSSDGTHVAYFSGRSVILDGKYVVQKGYTAQGVSSVTGKDLVFSNDGRHLVYSFEAYSSKVSAYLVLDGEVSEAYDCVQQITFSNDGDAVMFGARKGRELWWKVLPLK